MWLTAWLASYMMARLARRVRSQGACTSSGRARMRLPSVSPIVLTIADDSSGVVPGDHADAVGQVAGRRTVAAAEAVDQDGLADLDLVAGLEQGVLDRLAVDEGAVGAAAVVDAVAAAVQGQAELGVPAGNLGVVQADGVGGVAADAEDRPGQVELLALVDPLMTISRGTRRPPVACRNPKTWTVEAVRESLDRACRSPLGRRLGSSTDRPPVWKAALTRGTRHEARAAGHG